VPAAVVRYKPFSLTQSSTGSCDCKGGQTGREGDHVKAVIFDMGGVLARDVWEHLLPEGIAPKYSLDDKNLVWKVGALLWEAFAYR
jgi:hypothetical protein